MKKFAVIGHPVAHSLSPVMHAANFAALGFDGSYGRFDVEEGELAGFFAKCRAEGYLGVNVTVPHKMAVIPLLDSRDVSVERYGACNTVLFGEDGRMTGFNTDVAGFLDTLAMHGLSVRGKNVLVLGCGGAGSALALCAAFEGAAQVSIAARSAASTDALAEKFRSAGFAANVLAHPRSPGLDGRADVWGESALRADLVVNATPLGLKPGDEPVLPKSAFRAGQFVLDIIPTRAFPPTAAAAKEAGAIAADGLDFLVSQGAKSFEIWTGLEADRKAMRSALRISAE